MLDISEVGYVKRVVIGSNNPTNMQSEEQVAASMNLLNRCLTDTPKGRILGIEKSFSILQVGEHNVVLQWLTYHIGFARPPYWLEEEGAQNQPGNNG
ncbi:MAG: hypothetical protein WAW87_11150 [Candidatus Ferrigenium altingense]|jgi:hypothetical protein